MIRTIAIAGCGLLPGMFLSAIAATFCVSDTTQLQQALTLAQANGQDNEIRVRQGTYGLPNGGFQHETDEDFDLEISGGWFGPGSTCLDDSGSTAFDTVLDGDQRERVLRINPGMFNDLTVSNLMFSNGLKSGGAGLNIDPDGGLFRGTLLVERCAFIGNEAFTFGGSALSSSEGETVRIRNNLFVENRGDNTVRFIQTTETTIYFNNNTVIDNLGGGVNFSLLTSGPFPQLLIANNILWGNDGSDISLAVNGGTLVLRNNNIGVAGFDVDVAGTGNLSIDPMLEIGPMMYGPLPLSTMRDSGLRPPRFSSIPPQFDELWSSGDLDFLGFERIQGSGIDLGAFEALPNLLFQDGFE